MRKKIMALAVFAMLALLTSCGAVDRSALHINYDSDEVYGSGDYLYSTLTVTGSGVDRDRVYSVRELEEMTENDRELACEGEYSMLTRGSEFSLHEMTGMDLYEFLKRSGLDEDAGGDMPVSLVSADGYVSVMPLEEIRNSRDNVYRSMDDSRPVEENVPVMLAFGSGGLPLTGPVGTAEPGEKTDEKGGFDEDACNVGGPVRLIGGQKSADEYNAPDNAKWVRKIVVGDETERDMHRNGDEGCLKVRVRSSSGELETSREFTYRDVEDCERTAENYYDDGRYYRGADLWFFLASSIDFSSREGKVKLEFRDGSERIEDMAYFRNLDGDYSGYTTKKDGLTITGVRPAIGWSSDGKPSKDGIYGLIPGSEERGVEPVSGLLESIELELEGDSLLSENPYAGETLEINGSGVRKDREVTIGQLEADPDLRASEGDRSGVSLAALLEDTGVAVDAGTVTVKGDREAKLTWDELEKDREGRILVTREGGRPPEEGGPLKMDGVNDIREITVGVRKGQWDHSSGVYREMLDEELKVSGSAAVRSRTYSLEELEGKDYVVKDSFGASGGIRGYKGVILRDLIKENMKKGDAAPGRITVIGRDGYSTELSVKDVMSGIESRYQPGEKRDVIIAFSSDGVPLVRDEKTKGYKDGNGFGPMRLVAENQISRWVKSVKEIRIDR